MRFGRKRRYSQTHLLVSDHYCCEGDLNCSEPRVSLVAQTVKNLPTMQETWVRSLGREDPLEKGMAIHSIFLPGEFHGQGNLVGSMGLQRVRTVHGVTKSWTGLSDSHFQLGGVDTNAGMKCVASWLQAHTLIKSSWLPKMGIIYVDINMCILVLRTIKIDLTQKLILLRQKKVQGCFSAHNTVLK